MKVAMIEVERREYVRIDCLIATQILRIRRNNELERGRGITKNISASGLLFKAAEKYEEEAILSIEIAPGILEELDENRARVIKTRGFVLGKVVRSEEAADGTFECAVAFIASRQENKEYLRFFQDLINRATFS